MGPNILSQVADVYRKLRFTLRFLMGNLADFNPSADVVPYAALPAVDRFTLAQFAALLDDAAAAYDAFQFSRVYQVLLRPLVAVCATCNCPPPSSCSRRNLVLERAVFHCVVGYCCFGWAVVRGRVVASEGSTGSHHFVCDINELRPIRGNRTQP